MYDGIIVINKEKGFTSHDVVNVVRKTLGMRKVGHTGTLDPEAEGVLPICLGKGTKVSDMLMFSDKEYIAGVKLGISTDTQDIWGNVLDTSDKTVSREEFERVVNSFVGEITQVPPMYSAIKVNGKKLYEYAREGKEVERKERKVTIYGIDILSFDDEIKIKVACSKGTYIRTLINDIGEALGTYACMDSLVRTKSSVFTLENAVTLDELKAYAEEGKAGEHIMSIDSVFESYPAIYLDDEQAFRITNGAPSGVKANVGTYRAYDKDGNFLCVADVKREMSKNGNMRNVIKLVKAFF